MDSQEDKHLRKPKSGGMIEKRPHVPKMLWMKNRLQKNKSSGSSDLMDRVQTFLKQIAESNRQLEETAAKNPESVNVENTDDCEGNVIEMNLAMVPMDRDSSDEDDSSDEEDSDDDDSLQTDHKKQNGGLVQVLSADNEEILDDDEEEESSDVIAQDDDDDDDNGELSNSSDDDSSVMMNSKLKAEPKKGPLVEVISGFTNEDKLDNAGDDAQDENRESDDNSKDCGSELTVDMFSSLRKERSGPLIEVLNPDDARC